MSETDRITTLENRVLVLEDSLMQATKAIQALRMGLLELNEAIGFTNENLISFAKVSDAMAKEGRRGLYNEEQG